MHKNKVQFICNIFFTSRKEYPTHNSNQMTMTRQEILSWSSLGYSIVALSFYAMYILGWAGSESELTSDITSILFNIFWISLAIELVIGLTERKTKVQKDERDEKIEARGHRNAYYLLMVSIMVILFQIFFSNLIGEVGTKYLMLGSPQIIFHALFVVLFLSSMVKRATMIYYYRGL